MVVAWPEKEGWSVHQEVALYNLSQPGYFQGLVQPNDAEATLNGYRLRQRRQIDWEKQADLALKAFEANGGKVLAAVPHEQGAPSYSAELRKALEGKPQVVAAFSYPISATVYMKEAIEFFNFNNFFFCDGTKSVQMIEDLGAESLDMAQFIHHYFINMKSTSSI